MSEVQFLEQIHMSKSNTIVTLCFAVIFVLITAIIITTFDTTNHSNYKTAAPGYSIVEDGNGNYAAKHDESGYISSPRRGYLNRFSKQSAIDWSWRLMESRKQEEQFQNKWKQNEPK